MDDGATSLTRMVMVAVSLPAVLVAVMVYCVDGETADGVPDTVPVEASMDRPEGRVGVMEYESTVPVP